MTHPVNVEPADAQSGNEYQLITELHEIAVTYTNNKPLPKTYVKTMERSATYLRSQEQERAPIYRDEIPHR